MNLRKRVIQFAEVLLFTLKYLDLGGVLLSKNIDILLNHCNVPLKKLLINCLKKKRHVEALIEFCMRNRTLKYLGINRYLDYWDLDDDYRKVEEYVTVIPYERIVVNC
ncbi:hypothetical protein F8M41_017916 [Gigaspora margarita]|uniref:Uncharacterized protein n=1 Tax=Gigaspora margarita TaxID=4874 RepID=A0A8H4B2P0_GIGMA|nr:hypothetical protein F8M41_017916 [Gigaspora margarita]